MWIGTRSDPGGLDHGLAQGGPWNVARARSLLGQALALYQKLGVDGEARRVRARLRDLLLQQGASPAILLPAGLAPREAQVLRQVAAGKSNREIALELAISESTVAKHLTSIFILGAGTICNFVVIARVRSTRSNL